MKIAIVGWGSLIWDPRGLDIEPKWHADGPMLPLEFARFSSRERLTLVLVDGTPLQQTLWTLSGKATVLDAVSDLRVREVIWSHDIGRWTRANAKAASCGIDAVIGPWVESKVLDGAVWTALGPNRRDERPGLADEGERLAYLKELIASGRAAAAKEYFERAPAQIATPFRELVRRELGWG